ncbi:helix-turn-helix domain-containing protein [Brevibacillus parabrevis]|uniref:helix-turn-helix domain-containing protein n=1 Tax=Brevibacillus parabrevis TaxID=54914 RepID=UPI002852FFAF|nr:helix-turn-helix transcriptional regulator [Brevibacillus parabrevis]MDR4997863.1 helix-turn-helix transcriptional regulator [Brevibacillus parabrevis]
MNFTKAVLTALEKTNMKKSELARATGYSNQYIYDLLSGKRRWNEESINKVCGALGFKIEIEEDEGKTDGATV